MRSKVDILPRWENEEERTSVARSVRQQLEQQMSEHRADIERHATRGWHSEESSERP